MNPVVKLIRGAAIAALASSVLVAAPALAAPPENREPRSVIIDYSRIDLSSVTGQELLQSKIKQAARKVCDVGSGGAHRFELIWDQRSCMKHALASASVQTAALFGRAGDPQLAITVGFLSQLPSG